MTAVSYAGIRVVLLDVEGTTTPISFVYETLFPYARRRLREYLRAHATEPEIARAIELFRRERRAESIGADAPEWVDVTPASILESAADYAEWLMERDRKSPALKELQGLIWRQGYQSGVLRGEVFPDVPDALRRWRAAGIRTAIYSSGSVLAQKLLFGTTTLGDLTALIDGHFDTAVGAKRDRASYEAIAATLSVAPNEILFLSDTGEELDAAAKAGCNAALVIRPGNQKQAAPGIPVVRQLSEVMLDS